MHTLMQAGPLICVWISFFFFFFAYLLKIKNNNMIDIIKKNRCKNLYIIKYLNN